MTSVQQKVDELLAESDSPEHRNEVLLGQMRFLYRQSLYTSMISVAKKIDTEKLDSSQKNRMYSELAYAYQMLGDTEMANEYYNKSGDD